MSEFDAAQTSRMAAVRRGMLFVLILALTGCEVNSFFDQSDVGRTESTPAVMPILTSLDIVGDEPAVPPGLSQVQEDDLRETVREYVLVPGDLVTVTVFELIVPGQDYVQTRRVNELGEINLPDIGKIKIEGLTPTQLEKKISKIVIGKGRLPEPEVSVIVQNSQGNTYTIVGDPGLIGSRPGTYNILGKEFRLLNAVALAGGINSAVKKIYVVRQVSLQVGPNPLTSEPAPGEPAAPAVTPPSNPADLVPLDLMKDLLPAAEPGTRAPAPPSPPAAGPESAAIPLPGVEPGLGLEGDRSSPWVNVGGKWIKNEPGATVPTPALGAPMALRNIEIPLDKLQEGDPKYNIIIRAGDVIRVPTPPVGNIYLNGQINRPGTYTIPAEYGLTLMRAVAASGGLANLSVPQRVDLVRHLGPNQQAFVRVDVAAIFAGTEPDIYLKPDDFLNFRTNFLALPVQVVRNGFRASYGFGFVLDRNFEQEAFGSLSR